MFVRAAVDDEERQVNVSSHSGGTRSGTELDRTLSLRSDAQHNEQSNTTEGRVCKQESLQSCFLCLRGGRETYHAIRIPCFRPGLKPLIRKNGNDWTWKNGNDWKPPSVKTLSPPERVRNGYCEKDSAIYEKLVAACYEYYGVWKKWIPFYGIVDVREVEFHYNATTDDPDRFEVELLQLDHDEILRKANRDVVCNDLHQRNHREANLRIQTNIGKAWRMKKCALDPAYADRLTYSTLNGMALEVGPILANCDIKSPPKNHDTVTSTNPRLPGIEFVMGWQTHRFVEEMSLPITTTLFTIAVIWVIVVAGGLAGDWNLWVAMGQLLVASVALLLIRLK